MKLCLLSMVLVILFGFCLRVLWLDNLPLSLSLDESVDGLDALQLWRTHWLTPFLQNNFGRETLFLYVQGLAVHLFGIAFFSLRFASVLVGTLTIALMYAVGRQMALLELGLPRLWVPTLVGLLAAAALAASYWHVYFSRQALRAILLPPILLGAVWCFWRGWHTPLAQTRRQGRYWLAAAGFLLGLTLYTYLAARLLPFLFLLFAIMEIAGNPTMRRQKGINLLVFLSVMTLVSFPLVLYFARNPQAFGSRMEAIAVLLGDSVLQTLGHNLLNLMLIQFGGGWWLGHWPSLDFLSSLGLLAGLLVCLRYIRRPTARFLLLWWGVGLAPVLLSRQDWDAVTTILRGIVAWPAVALISAIGLTALTGLGYKVACRLGYHRTVRPGDASQPCTPGRSRLHWLAVPPLALLVFGGIVCFYNYFVVWARSIDPADDDARVLAGYLNSQQGQLILTPNRFFTNGATNFLLQARYPNLVGIDAEELRTLLTSHRSGQPGPAGAVYLLPHGETSQSAWTLLDPSSGTGVGTAYLLPYFTRAQTMAMAEQTQAMTPILTIADRRHEIIADVYPLKADAPFLPYDSVPMHPLHASFGGDILLNGYYVEPPTAQPGQEVGLSLSWQAQRCIDSGHDLFIHVFNIQTGQRYGQINTSLGSSVLLQSHWWPTGMKVVDTYYFALPQDAPEGAYRFEVGLYHRTSLERLPVMMGNDAQTSDDKVILGKFLVQRQPPPLPQHRLQAQFGDGIALIGFDVSGPIVEAGQSLAQVTLYWQALTPISTDYTVFVHLLDRQGNLRSQHDSMPQQGRYPTSLWSPGETIPDVHDLPLRADMPPGDYTVRVGLYNLQTGQRLPLKDQAGDYVDLPMRWP